MNQNTNAFARRSVIAGIALAIALITTPSLSADYAALEGVKRVKAVFDVSLGSPRQPTLFFGL